MVANDFERDLRKLFTGAREIVILAVGDELDPRDCLGYLAGKELASLKLKGVKVLITHQMPENFTSKVREIAPSHVVIIDAAEMGRRPGEVAFIEKEKIAASRVSTHGMPLSVLMEYLRRELDVRVSLIGIQPAAISDISSGMQPQSIIDGIQRIVDAVKSSIERGP